MKKSIFVVRHGHASLTASKDYERVLTLDGIKAVNKTAEFIHQTCHDFNLSIDLCLTSAAHRTKQTADIICFKNCIDNCIADKDLYSTFASKWIDEISKLPNKNIVLVGHNPTLSQLINTFCGYDGYMQPADCAFITLEIKPDGIIYPAQLKQFYHHEI